MLLIAKVQCEVNPMSEFFFKQNLSVPNRFEYFQLSCNRLGKYNVLHNVNKKSNGSKLF